MVVGGRRGVVRSAGAAGGGVEDVGRPASVAPVSSYNAPTTTVLPETATEEPKKSPATGVGLLSIRRRLPWRRRRCRPTRHRSGPRRLRQQPQCCRRRATEEPK